MTDTPSRMFALLCVLVGVWILTFWLYEPSASRSITRDELPKASGVLDGSEVVDGSVVVDGLSQGTSTAALTSAPIGASEAALGLATGGVADTVPNLPSSSAPPPPRRVVVKPRFTEYVVQRGDTGWEAIAKRHYGDSSKWRAVSQANPMVTSDRLYPGRTKLRIPVDPENIQGKVVWMQGDKVIDPPAPESAGSSGDAPARAETQAAPLARPPDAPERSIGTSYTIQAGDTLWSISKAFYGKAALWERIHAANRELIPDPNRAPVGQTITIPPP